MIDQGESLKRSGVHLLPWSARHSREGRSKGFEGVHSDISCLWYVGPRPTGTQLVPKNHGSLRRPDHCDSGWSNSLRPDPGPGHGRVPKNLGGGPEILTFHHEVDVVLRDP